MLKFSKRGFNSIWTENFQMFNLHFKREEKPEIKLPTSIESKKKQENFRKTSASLTMLKPLTVWITTNWKILIEMGIPDHLTIPMWNKYTSPEATVRTRYGRTNWLQIVKGVRQDCTLSPCLFNLYSESSLVQWLSCYQLVETPWTAAGQASLSITKSQSLLNSCSLSQWCHPTISSSVVCLSSCLQSFPTSESFFFLLL